MMIVLPPLVRQVVIFPIHHGVIQAIHNETDGPDTVGHVLLLGLVRVIILIMKAMAVIVKTNSIDLVITLLHHEIRMMGGDM